MTEPRRSAPPIVCWLAAAGGIVLAAEAVQRGGLLRYQLAGVVVGVALCAPLLVVLLAPRRGRVVLRRLAFALVPLGVLLALAEVVLRATGVGAANVVRVVADEQLGHRLEPGHGDADANGYRNERALAQADVVVLGDSVGYGFGVARDETFVARAAAATGLSTYSMCLAGYGPVQYRELAKRALALRPRVLVVGFFLGNDVIDAVAHAHLPHAADLRQPGRDYPAFRVAELDPPGAPNLALAAFESVVGASRLASLAARGLRDVLRDRSGLWHAEAGCIPSGGPNDTLLVPHLQLPLLDRSQPRVAEGLTNAQRCLEHVAAACRDAGVRPVLLLLPTKERCHQQLALANGASRPELAAVHAAEITIAEALGTSAHAAGFAVVDPADSLVRALHQGRRCWPRGSDPHPAAGGHAEIAAVLAAALQQLARR